ncbi:MAG: hypothetical protein V2A78_11910 [bacterium]
MTPEKEREKLLKLVQIGIFLFIFLVWGGFLFSVWVRHSLPPEKGNVPSSRSVSETPEKSPEPEITPAAAPTAAASPTPRSTKFRKQSVEDPRESPSETVQPEMTSPAATLFPQSFLPSPEPEAQEDDIFIRDIISPVFTHEEKVRPTATEERPRQYLLNGEKIFYSPDISEKKPSVIEENGQMNKIIDKALHYLESRFEFVFNRPLAFEFVTREEMDKTLKDGHIGFYLKGSDSGQLFHRVYIEKDKMYEEIFDTTLHELTHAWQIENCPPDQDEKIMEGFATWIACKGLFDDGDYALYHQYIDHMRNPVYGVGFRYILHLEDEIGEKKVVEFMKTARELPEY